MPPSRPNSASDADRGESSSSSKTQSSIPSRPSSDKKDGRIPETRQSPSTFHRPSPPALSSQASDGSGGFHSLNPNTPAAPTRKINRAQASSSSSSSRQTTAAAAAATTTPQHESLHIFDSRCHALSDAEKGETQFEKRGVFRKNEALTESKRAYKNRCLNCRDVKGVKRDLGEGSFASKKANPAVLPSVREVDGGNATAEEKKLGKATSGESEKRSTSAVVLVAEKKVLKRRKFICCATTALIIIAGIVGGTVWCVVYFLRQRQVGSGGGDEKSFEDGLGPPSPPPPPPASPDLPPTPSSIEKKWVQVGSDLLPPPPPPLSANSNHRIERHFGRTVSMSENGRRVAVGTPETYQKGGSSNGLVAVYELSPKTKQWEVKGEAIRGKKAKDRTGASVSLDADGTRLAVGSLGDDTGDGGFVSVYTYKNGNAGWTLLGEPIRSSRRGNQFAFSVSLSGDGTTVAIGAPETTTANVRGRNEGDEVGGSVRVYRYDTGKRKWIRMGSVLRGQRSVASVINNDDDRFGHSVSLSFYGNNIAVGAPRANSRGGARAGYAYVYDYEKKGNRGKMDWEMSHKQRGSAAGDQAGGSVSMDYIGDFFVFGSKNANGVDRRNGAKVEKAGSVGTYFYAFESSDWYMCSFPLNGQKKRGYFGSSVALSGDSFTLAVASETSEGGNGAGLGLVSVYERYEYDISQWSPVGEEIVGDKNVDEIGTSHALALSEHGRYIVIGSEGKRDDISGRARVYEMVRS